MAIDPARLWEASKIPSSMWCARRNGKRRSCQAFKIYHQGGELYPHLMRDDSKSDVLSKIIEPLAK
jgi:hypothetical protein